VSSVSAAASQQKQAAGRGRRHVIRGGSGNDVLRGTPRMDVIYGGRGNDRIYGRPGNDLIDGGLGSDRVYGGAGNDVIHGDRGNDRIYGGAGNDVIYGGPGREVIDGGRGDDRIIGEGGATRVSAGSGTNWVDVADGGQNDRVVCAAGSVNHIVADRGDQVGRSCLGKGSTLGTGGSGVSNATWMHDLGGQLWSRKLSDIVIPGSHDTGTYALPNDPISLIGKAQSEDITSQLNDGARSFDIRVKWSLGLGPAVVTDPCNKPGYYAVHGILTACSLTLPDIFNQIATWANAPGHEQEIILVGLQIDPNHGPGPGSFCQALGTALGTALLTPSDLKAAGYSADPGQVTLGQLWSMPGHPRVLLSDSKCMDAADPGAGTWDPDPPFGAGAGQSFYANQCYADGYEEWWDFQDLAMPGIKATIEPAAQTRASQGGGDNTDPGDPVQPGPPMKGGLWSLFVQATPTVGCLKSLAGFDLVQQDKVLAALYQDWWPTFDAVKANVNVIGGDFVQDGDLVKDAIAMDETYPEVPGAITPVGAEKVMAPSNSQPIPATDFAARVTDYTGAALPGAQVIYHVSGPRAAIGFGVKRDKTRTVTADAQGDVNPVDALWLDPEGTTGTWTVTASAGGVTATWTVDVVPPTGTHLVADTCPCSGQVSQPYNVSLPNHYGLGSFEVEVRDASGNTVDGVPVTFDAGSAGVFVNGNLLPHSVTVPTTFYDLGGHSNAVAPEFIPETEAGTFSISVSAPGADNTLSLRFTATPGSAAQFFATQGHNPSTASTPINTKLPIPLKGHWADQYGNVAVPPPGGTTLTVDPASGVTWPNGKSSITVKPDANGTITAPDLTAGNTVLATNPPYGLLHVFAGGFPGWYVAVTPGPAAKVATIGGTSQQTAARKSFAHALAVKVTDARGHPIAGASVIFKVTSGAAAFAPVNPRLAAAAVIGRAQALRKNAKRRRIAVTEPTNAQGVAKAPALFAGAKAESIEVTASVGASRRLKAVFHASVVSAPRRHRSPRIRTATPR
jgi:RTX calcium-binding nonapeptide repeat (4 copies)